MLFVSFQGQYFNNDCKQLLNFIFSLVQKGVQQIREEERLVEKQTHGGDFETNNAKLGIEMVNERHDFEMLHQQ